MNKKAFSLIELMVVVSIIGVLSAIVIPKFLNITADGKVANVQGNLVTLRTSLEMYNSIYEEFPDLISNFSKFEEVYSKDKTPSTPSFEGNKENNNIFNSRDNTGGWVYYRSLGYIFANLSNGTYTGNDLKEVWVEEALYGIADKPFVLSDDIAIGMEVSKETFIKGKDKYFQSEIGGWKIGTDRPNEDGVQVNYNGQIAGVNATQGDNYFQLGGRFRDTPIYQDIAVKGGTALDFSMDHRGVSSTEDTTNLNVTYTKDGIKYTDNILSMSTNNSGWQSYNNSYTVPEGVKNIRVSIEPEGRAPFTQGNLVDNFNVSVAD